MYKSLLLFILAFVLFSCGKSEKDYSGKYETLYATEVKLSSHFDGMSIFGKGKAERHTAKKYYELLPIKINFFFDESDKKMKGECEISSVYVSKYATKPTASKSKMDFDIVNIRLENDTLRFQIVNELLQLSGKKIKGQLIRKGDKAIIGLEIDAFSLNDYTDKNPLFIAEVNEMIYYSTTSSINQNEVKNRFYTLQIADFKDKIKTAKNETDKIYLENSIVKVEALNQ